MPPRKTDAPDRDQAAPAPSGGRARSSLPTLLTVARVAESMDTSERHVRRLIADGTLPAYHLSTGVVRVGEDDFRAYLASRRR